MRAIRVHEFGEPEVMRIEERPALSPDRGRLVVRLMAAGVNPVDTYIRSGQYARLPELPYTPGIDGAGIVDSVGADVHRFQVGDRGYVAGSISGTYAEQAVCAEAEAHLLPERLSFQQGAAIGVPYTAAYRALFHRAAAKPGETLLVHGATGGVGIAATQLARAAGLTVFGTGGTEQGRELVRAQGAHHVLDHRKDGYLDQIMGLTNGRGVDVIVELLANVNLSNDLKLLSQGGRVVVIGSRGTVEIDPRDAMKRDASILGLLVFNASEDELVRIHAALGAGLENGALTPVIGKEFQLSQAAEAHRAVMQAGAHGKIILLP
jgi:NADPH:quinone reductase